jgi:hypothetical protein
MYTTGYACGVFIDHERRERKMKLNGHHIFVKLLEPSDAEASLRLEVRNRDFFQMYTPLRSDDFYTLEGQLERIKKGHRNARTG